MKQISIYISTLIFAFIIAASCAKDEIGQDSLKLEEGCLKLSLEIQSNQSNQTKAQGEDILSNSILKIYKKSGDDFKLIRRYAPATEIPDNIYFIAGEYKVTMSVGEKSETNCVGFDDTSLIYYGEQQFPIVAKQMTSVSLVCKMLNSAVKVVYVKDDLFNQIFENGLVTTLVSTSDEFSVDPRFPTLNYDESDLIGYYLLPDGVSNLSWGFFKGISSALGEKVTKGVISSPKPATLYTLTFKYSKTPDGILDLNILVDESAIEFDDSFIFSPQPSIQGEGIKELYSFVDSDIVYNVSSIKNLTSIEIITSDMEANTQSTFKLLEGGALVDLSAYGITYAKTDNKNGTISLSKSFFNKYISGGEKSVDFVIIDESANKGEASAKINVTGLLASPTVDLWANTAILQAVLTDPSISDNVIISYRKSGDATWTDLAATKGEDGLFSVNTTPPTWKTEQNSAGLDVNTLTSGFSANNSYECKLTIAGTEYPTLSFTTKDGHKIPYGDMEDSSLKCWGIDENKSVNWTSSSNSMAKGLCKFGTYTGMGGSHCAELSTGSPMLVNIAAGSLCLGQFEQSGTNGTMSFGQAFTWESRPKTFKFKCAAVIGTVNQSFHDGAPIKKGDKDMARVIFAIVDWDSRHGVKSGLGAPSGMWDPVKDMSVPEGKIIGYASKFITESITNMQTIELPIYYYDTVTKPSGNISIVVSFSTNAYGDYLVGSTDSKLFIDDIELAY